MTIFGLNSRKTRFDKGLKLRDAATKYGHFARKGSDSPGFSHLEVGANPGDLIFTSSSEQGCYYLYNIRHALGQNAKNDSVIEACFDNEVLARSISRDREPFRWGWDDFELCGWEEGDSYMPNDLTSYFSFSYDVIPFAKIIDGDEYHDIRKTVDALRDAREIRQMEKGKELMRAGEVWDWAYKIVEDMSPGLIRIDSLRGGYTFFLGDLAERFPDQRFRFIDYYDPTFLSDMMYADWESQKLYIRTTEKSSGRTRCVIELGIVDDVVALASQYEHPNDRDYGYKDFKVTGRRVNPR